MGLEKRYLNTMGTENDMAEMLSIIKNYKSINYKILDHYILLPRTTPYDLRSFYYYEIMFKGSVKSLKTLFRVLNTLEYLWIVDLDK